MEFSYLVRNNGPLAVTSKRLGPNGNYITEIGLFDSLYRLGADAEGRPGREARWSTSTGYNDRGSGGVPGGTEHTSTGEPSTDGVATEPGRGPGTHRASATTGSAGWSAEDAVVGQQPTRGRLSPATAVTRTAGRSRSPRRRGARPPSTISDVHGQDHGAAGVPRLDPDRRLRRDQVHVHPARATCRHVVGPTGKTWSYEYDLRGRKVTHHRPGQGHHDLVPTTTPTTSSPARTPWTRWSPSSTTTSGGRSRRYVDGELIARPGPMTRIAKGHLIDAGVDRRRLLTFSREISIYNNAYQIMEEASVIPAMPGLDGGRRDLHLDLHLSRWTARWSG